MVKPPPPKTPAKKIIPKKIKCIACEGRGKQSKGNATCPICKGTGFKP